MVVSPFKPSILDYPKSPSTSKPSIRFVGLPISSKSKAFQLRNGRALLSVKIIRPCSILTPQRLQTSIPKRSDQNGPDAKPAHKMHCNLHKRLVTHRAPQRPWSRKERIPYTKDLSHRSHIATVSGGNHMSCISSTSILA